MSLALISQLYYVEDDDEEDVGEGDEVKDVKLKIDPEEVGRDVSRSEKEDLQCELVEETLPDGVDDDGGGKEEKTVYHEMGRGNGEPPVIHKGEVDPVYGAGYATGVEAELEPEIVQELSNGKKVQLQEATCTPVVKSEGVQKNSDRATQDNVLIMCQSSNETLELAEQQKKKGVPASRRPSMWNWSYRKRRHHPKNTNSKKASARKKQTMMTRPCETTAKVEGDTYLDLNPMESQDESDPLKKSERHSSILLPKEEAAANKKLLLKCPYCFLVYAERDDLIKHLSVHVKKTVKDEPKIPRKVGRPRAAGDGTALCSICGKILSCKQALTVHMRLHTGETPYDCLQCKSSFRQLSDLRYHMKLHDSSRPWKCSWCSLYFLKESTLKHHIRIHTVKNPFKCLQCNSSFRQRVQLQLHRSVHKLQSSTLKNDNGHTGNGTTICNVCGKSLSSKGALVIHMRVHTGQRPHKCVKCSSAFMQTIDLRRHMKLHDPSNRPFKCSLCSLYFLTEGFLANHRTKYHSEGKNRRDEKSDKKRKRQSPPQAYQSQELPQLPACHVVLIRCDDLLSPNQRLQISAAMSKSSYGVDDQPFPVRRKAGRKANKGILKMKIEGALAKYDQGKVRRSRLNCKTSAGKNGKDARKTPICTICLKTFASWQGARMHIRTHTKEQPFKCQHCSRVFSQIASLGRHIRVVHLRQRPFACQYCGKRTSSYSNLQTHLIVHTNKRPFQCSMCPNKCYRDQGNLKIHIQSHHNGGQRFECPKCDKKFRSIAYRNGHFKRVHQKLG